MINRKSSIIVVLVGLIFTINYIVNNEITNDAELRSMKIRNSMRLDEMSFASLENPRFSQREYKHYKVIVDPNGADGISAGDSAEFDSGRVLDDAWKDWKASCGKNWDDTQEEQKRRQLWEKRYLAMERNNERNATFTEAQTCTMDMTDEEIQESYFGLHDKPQIEAEDSQDFIENFVVTPVDQKLPEYVNWHNVINLPIRDQKCADCWANSGTTALEALYQIIGNEFQLSQLVNREAINCDLKKNQNGCNGGDYPFVFKYTKQYGAIPDQDEPYKGVYNPNDDCFNSKKYKEDNKKFVNGFMRAKTCDGLKAALSKQPVNAGIRVDQSFMSTTTSTYPFKETNQSLNHAVTVIGYTPEYWIIQNSWGTMSHYNGFVKLAMGNTIGICQDVAWPTSDSPLKVKPDTKPIDFLKDFSDDDSNSKILPVNLNSLIGSKFAIAGRHLKKTGVYQNIKGEQFKSLSNNYYYIPEGRQKTDFNYLQLSITFINEAGNPFEFIFVTDTKSGQLISQNFQTNDWYLGYCGSYDKKAKGVLQSYCSKVSNKSLFYFIYNAQNDLISLYWFKPE